MSTTAISLESVIVTTTNTNPNFDEEKWVHYIYNSLGNNDLEIEIHETPVCISNVPKVLLSTSPESYTPQEVAIGPYHQWRRGVYEMERYKLVAAKRSEKYLSEQGLTLHDVVNHIREMDTRIRACYHKFLYVSDMTLAWMMVINASFLLEILFMFNTVKEGKVTGNSSGDLMSYWVDYVGKKCARNYNVILRDTVMLENQIPLFVLRKMLEVHCTSVELADEMLHTPLMGFCEELSPFTITKNAAKPCLSKSHHLLDYLYKVVVPEHKQISFRNPGEINVEDELTQQLPAAARAKRGFNSDYLKYLTNESWKRISNSNICSCRPLQLFSKLPWNIFSKIPGLAVIAKPVQYLFFSPGSKEKEESSSSLDDGNKPPLLEEIKIPSVTELIQSRVRFTRTESGNISRIRFDTKTATLYLPRINIDINSEVVIRNLVAYEDSKESGPFIFTRYTELMSGIIDTEEDVKLLRERGIILNRLNSDADVANLWNGMTKSIRLAKVPSIDKVIEDVNKYYNSRWRIMMRNCTRRYVFESWKVLTMLATILMLTLMMLQSFCSVYYCNGLIRNNMPPK